MRGVGVAAKQVQQPLLRQLQRHCAMLGARHERGRPLDQAACLYEFAQHLHEAGRGMALGVSDHDAQPFASQALRELQEVSPKRAWRRLQQHPGASAERKLAQRACL